MHPAVMNRLGIRTDRDVFGDGGETRTCFCEAILQFRFVRKLVLEHIQIEHEESMLAGGFEKIVVPLERGEALGRAFAIEGLEELALRVIALQLRVRVCGK